METANKSADPGPIRLWTFFKTKEFLSGIFFLVCSAGMTLLNKAILSTFSFNYPNAIMALQMATTVISIKLLQLVGLTKQDVHFVYSDKYLMIFFVAYYLNTILSLNALHGLNIPIYGAVKRCTAFVNLILSVLFLKKSMPGWIKLLSIVMITGGCIMAGSGDVHFDWNSYILGICSIVTHALYMTMAEKLATQTYSSTILTYSCAIATFPLFFLMSFYLKEIEEIKWSDYTGNHVFMVLLVALTIGGTLLSLANILSAKINSAVATSLLGSFKAVVQTVLGFIIFPDAVPTVKIIAGISINVIGSFLYAYRGKKTDVVENLTIESVEKRIVAEKS